MNLFSLLRQKESAGTLKMMDNVTLRQECQCGMRKDGSEGLNFNLKILHCSCVLTRVQIIRIRLVFKQHNQKLRRQKGLTVMFHTRQSDRGGKMKQV